MTEQTPKSVPVPLADLLAVRPHWYGTWVKPDQQLTPGGFTMIDRTPRVPLVPDLDDRARAAVEGVPPRKTCGWTSF